MLKPDDVFQRREKPYEGFEAGKDKILKFIWKSCLLLRKWDNHILALRRGEFLALFAG